MYQFHNDTLGCPPAAAPRKRDDIIVVGAGCVGLVTSVGLAKLGHTVRCVDIDRAKVALLRSGIVPYFEPDLPDLLTDALSSGRISFHTSFKDAYRGQRYIFLAVPTPMKPDGDANLAILRDCIDTVAALVQHDALLIVKSTVPVGVFDELSQSYALRNNDRITLVSCPEFLAEGSAVRDFFHPKRTVVGSHSDRINREVGSLFAGVSGGFISTNAVTAQLIKYSSNCFLATRVAYINEISMLCERVGANVSDVSNALLMDTRLGQGYLSAGVGFAGPCLPKDISALIETGKKFNAPVALLSAVRHQNAQHLAGVISTIRGLVMPNDIVGVFGLSFKPGTSDVRNSSAITIVEKILEDETVRVKATDPQAIAGARDLIRSNRVSFTSDPVEAAAGTSLQVFLTPWPVYASLDLRTIGAVAAKRNIFDATRLFDFDAVTKLGFAYQGIGAVFPDGRRPHYVTAASVA